MNNYGFRLARETDLEKVMTIVFDAQKRLALHQSGQWQDGHPTRETIINDIEQKHLYVSTFEDEVVGMMAVLTHEPSYDHLLSGAWRHEGPYLVVHRFATHRMFLNKGVGTFMLSQIEILAKGVKTHLIRVDTHAKNKEMDALLLKCGFVVCGTTLIDQTKLRTVYEKYLNF